MIWLLTFFLNRIILVLYMEIRRETDYAIRCVYYLAERLGEIIMVDEIARKTDIPKSFLAKILQKLARAKFVISHRGAKGGFQLAKNPKEINLLSVIEAVQGPLFVNKCMTDQRACSRRSICAVHPVWQIISDCLLTKLREFDFERLVSEGTLMTHF